MNVPVAFAQGPLDWIDQTFRSLGLADLFALPGLLILTVILVVAIIAVKILVGLASPVERRRYGRAVTATLILGIIVGLLLPFNLQAAELTAGLTSIFFLITAVYYHVTHGRIATLPLLHRLWIPRERIRDLFLYFSIGTGVIGLTTTILSLVTLPPLPSVSTIIPLIFDTLSVLSALLEFTIPTPEYSILNALTYLRCQTHSNPDPTKGALIMWSDLPSILQGTLHPKAALLDSLAKLVRQKLAVKEKHGFMKRASFRISPVGMSLLELDWKEWSLRLEHERNELEWKVKRLAAEAKRRRETASEIPNYVYSELASVERRLHHSQSIAGSMCDCNWFEERLKELDIRIGNSTV